MDLNNIRNILEPEEKYKLDNYKVYTFLGYLVYFAKKYKELYSYIDTYCKKFPNEVNINNDRQWTPLLIAAYYDQNEVAKILLENGANINFINKYHNTAIMFCNDNFELMRILLDYDAANIPTMYKSINYPSFKKHINVYQNLIEKITLLNTKN